MEYLKLQRSFRSTAAWRGASSSERGAWVSLAGHCADEETGGRIVGARSWRPSAWLTIGVPHDDVEAAVGANLASWDGDDLVIAGYDQIGEATYKGRREQGSRGGSAPRAKASEPEAKSKRTLQNKSSVRSSERSTVRSSEPEAKCEPISISISTPTDQGQRQPRARTPDLPPLVVVAVSLGASLTGDDGIDLTPRWEAALAALTEQVIRAVFAAGPRLLRAGIRYPSGFTQVHEALIAEDGARTVNEQRDQRRDAQADERARCQGMATRVKDWLASAVGAPVRAKLTSSDRDAVVMFGDSHDGGLEAFMAVARKFPELERIAAEASGIKGRGAA